MVNCIYCNKETGYLPFKCNYCGNQFCKEHRLPENHDCTFEKKLVTKEISYSKELKEDSAPKELYQRGDTLSEKEIKRLFKEKKKDAKGRPKRPSSWIEAPNKTNGANFIVIMLFGFSIAALFIPQYVNLSGYGVLNLYIHTFFTSLFVVSAGGYFGLFFLFIIMFFLYSMLKSIELRYGTRFLLSLYTFCGLFGGLFFLLFRFLIVPVYPLELDFLNNGQFTVGLGWSAILGVIAFLIFPSYNAQWNMYLFMIPIRMSGKTMLIFLVLLRILPGLIYGLLYGPIIILIYCFELAGILASFLVYRYKFQINRS